jgi:hypothetical protein
MISDRGYETSRDERWLHRTHEPDSHQNKPIPPKTECLTTTAVAGMHSATLHLSLHKQCTVWIGHLVCLDIRLAQGSIGLLLQQVDDEGGQLQREHVPKRTFGVEQETLECRCNRQATAVIGARLRLQEKQDVLDRRSIRREKACGIKLRTHKRYKPNLAL